MSINRKSFLLQFIFNLSPKHTSKCLTHLPYIIPPKQQNMANQKYLDIPVSNIYDDHLITNQHSYLNYKSLINEQIYKKYLNINNINDQKPQHQTNKVQQNLKQLINRYIKQKDSFLIYSQIQQTISQLTVLEAQQNKKYLLYLFKQLLHPPPNSPELDQHIFDLKAILADKINLINETISSQQQQHLLQQARYFIKIGENQKAKTNYQQIINNYTYNSNSRMEALEFICEHSIENGDELYLLQIIQKIKPFHGQQKYIQHIKNTIKEINKNCQNWLNTNND